LVPKLSWRTRRSDEEKFCTTTLAALDRHCRLIVAGIPGGPFGVRVE
jgi:hypothetical protein